MQTPPPKAVKKATPAKKTPVKNGVGAKKAESEDDDDDDSGKWLSHFMQHELQGCFQLCCSVRLGH